MSVWCHFVALFIRLCLSIWFIVQNASLYLHICLSADKPTHTRLSETYVVFTSPFRITVNPESNRIPRLHPVTCIRISRYLEPDFEKKSEIVNVKNLIFYSLALWSRKKEARQLILNLPFTFSLDNFELVGFGLTLQSVGWSVWCENYRTNGCKDISDK